MFESINRAFMYGESVFTTMRMIESSLVDWDYHFERLKKGVEFVFGPFSDGDVWAAMLRERLDSRLINEMDNKVIRVTLYREQARGLIKKGLISVSDIRISVSSSIYDPSRFEGKALKLRSCAAPLRPHWWPSFLKAGDYLETILSQKLYMRPGDDDVLFLAQDDTVLASSVANIFVVKDEKLYTAPVGPNVLEGVMRRKVLESAKLFFDDYEESASTIEQLYDADAIIGTNSVRGPFLIDRIDDHEFNYEKDFMVKFDQLRKRVFDDLT